jgi:hypothetical protein
VGYLERYQIFVFKSREAMEQFKLGGKAGADVGASVAAGTAARQISFNPYFTVYQVSQSGFAVQANRDGTGHFGDSGLNRESIRKSAQRGDSHAATALR